MCPVGTCELGDLLRYNNIRDFWLVISAVKRNLSMLTRWLERAKWLIILVNLNNSFLNYKQQNVDNDFTLNCRAFVWSGEEDSQVIIFEDIMNIMRDGDISNSVSITIVLFKCLSVVV